MHDIETVNLSPVLETLVGFGKTLHSLLDSMRMLTEGLSEARVGLDLDLSSDWRAAGGLRHLSSVGTYEIPSPSAMHPTEFVKQRLRQLEDALRSQLDDITDKLACSVRILSEKMDPASGNSLAKPLLEVPLHPLPASVLDAATSSTLHRQISTLAALTSLGATCDIAAIRHG